MFSRLIIPATTQQKIL